MKLSETPEAKAMFAANRKRFEEFMARKRAEKITQISPAAHNRRVRAQIAQERMAQQQRDIPAQRLQEMMDQAQQAYLDRLRERAEDDGRTCHRGGGDPDWRA